MRHYALWELERVERAGVRLCTAQARHQHSHQPVIRVGRYVVSCGQEGRRGPTGMSERPGTDPDKTPVETQSPRPARRFPAGAQHR